MDFTIAHTSEWDKTCYKSGTSRGQAQGTARDRANKLTALEGKKQG